jgi:excisionase family DNA binding protein
MGAKFKGGERTMFEKLLEVEKAAKYLGVSEKTLYKWVTLKQIPYIKLSHKCLRFDMRDLDKWINEKKIQPSDIDDFMPDFDTKLFGKN